MQLKTIAKDAVASALAKAERYRLLNEPHEAESICRDVLAVDPGSVPAQVTLVLALSDQLRGSAGTRRVAEARELARALAGEYERAYYEGIVCERFAKAQLRQAAPGHVVYAWLRDAMASYERAEKVEPAGVDDAVLRWNACVRLIGEHPEIVPREDQGDDAFEGGDDAPR